MSAEAHRPVNGDTGETPEEAALARVLESYLAGLEAGHPADPDRLIAAHPELAGPLRACLKVMHLAAGLSGSSGHLAGPSGADPNNGGITASPGPSALTVIWPHDDPSSHLLLPEAPEDEAPIVQVGSDALPSSTEGIGAGRYQVLGEIARGGMGVVLRARDADLGRDLALKVLQSRHHGDPNIVGRFIEEARIGGQLQHPGIVPVHELGTLADRRPYFTMKLVKGRTLAALLAERSSPEVDLPRFLTIFEQVCQTVAYAHARRVIHRDLKPANVMVGSFGEVQVVDWGLAKVLPEGGVADEARAMVREETIIQTARSGPSGSAESQPGSVLGTPSYMAPEQARGELDRIDERADVFGLGAILCEVLTGRPPFGGSTREGARARAARGDLTGALRRLDACGTDAELIALACDCLAAEPGDRPRDAGAVARRMSAYQVGVQERLRAAELARVAAQARAEEERKRQRVTVALAASVLIAAGLAGGGWAHLARQRSERARQLDRASTGVELLYAEATRSGDDLTRWIAAREAAHALEEVLADAPDVATRDRLTALVRGVTQAAADAESDRRLLSKLADIRSGMSDDVDRTAAEVGYADAFREAGLDTEALSPIEVATRIRARPAAVRVGLAAALDDWAAVLGDHRRDQAGVRRLIEIARLADPDPWRDRLREVRQLGPRDARLAGLKELAASAPVDQLPAVSLHLLGRALLGLGASAEAELLLRRGVRRYADDVWINYELARCLERLAHREEAIRYYVAARALRLEFSHPLAHALEQTGETDRAIAVLEDLVRARPRDGRHLTCLGKALMDRDRDREGREALDAAISALRAEIARQPGRADLYVSLGLALLTEQRPGEAIPELRTAIRLKPDYPEAHFILARALRSRGGSDEPIAEYREALRLRPDYADAHNNLGNILRAQGDSDGAIAEYRDALRIDRDLPHAHYNLGNVLDDRGQQAEAIAEYRTALRLKPDYPEAHVNLGGILHTRGDLEEAIAEYRAAIRLRPGLVEAHNNLARALRARGEYPEAIAILRKACDMARRMAHPLAQQFQRELAITERFASLAARLPAIMAGEAKAADTTEAIDFARLCSDRGMQGTSTRLWSKAFQSQARLMEDMQAQHRYNAACTAALAGCGQGRDDPPLDNAARARWRKQAIDWLKADLAAWTKILESGPPQAKQAIMQTLRHWKVDTDLAGLRDPASLTKLAKDEQEACHALWEAVDALIAKASGNPR